MNNKNNIEISNKLVRYSRAGDVFHYRWAARRCLKMIYPNSKVSSIIIEGSKESKLSGEYVIDLSEYSESSSNILMKIEYYQLKHTTVHTAEEMGWHEIKNTIEGFAKRYKELLPRIGKTNNNPDILFWIITNRPINERIKKEFINISINKNSSPYFYAKLKEVTTLNGKELAKFCKLINFSDKEGNYKNQRDELQYEISQVMAGPIDSPIIDSITTLVQEMALPNSKNGTITKEDILKRLGVGSERDLFPAPTEYESFRGIIKRKSYDLLISKVKKSNNNSIIHAAGGVGKSVFANYVSSLHQDESLAVVYDCFGGGRYLNRSEFRHRYKDALVQISNELSSRGLCDPLIATKYSDKDDILRCFLKRIENAIKSLKKLNKNAILIILIDAADNAELAAQKYGESCFAHELLREKLPPGVRLVALCRTERRHLLQPSSSVVEYELPAFSETETYENIIRYYPNATRDEGIEFHRLTNNGNPRVQAYAFNFHFKTISETLSSLGPSGISINEQINRQIESAILGLKENLPSTEHNNINAICAGLATLPPLIPLTILSAASNVDESFIKSFVNDIGRPLWISDNSVHFRDEPTETWFREQFAASAEQISWYVLRLKPFANQYTYVAEALPSLFLQAEMYTELVDLALSDEYLPKNNPIDERNVRVYRLQFAYKAALKLKRYADAAKLALRAGEEVAGEQRQLELLRKNVDLIAPLQSEQKVQELAFRHLLKSSWKGSENVYSASLLSSVNDFRGEARGYLRSAIRWLKLYYEDRKESSSNNAGEPSEQDIVELAFAHFNLVPIEETIDFLLGWRPPEFTYKIAKSLIKRLIDMNMISKVNEISRVCKNKKGLNCQYLMIAIANELGKLGLYPDKSSLSLYLSSMTQSRSRIPRSKNYYDYQLAVEESILAFAEACAAQQLSTKKILKLLSYYFQNRSPRWIHDNYDSMKRSTYLRSFALKSALTNNLSPDLNSMLPIELLGKNNAKENGSEIEKFKVVVGELIPWYILRSIVITEKPCDISIMYEKCNSQSTKAIKSYWRENDYMPFEISIIHLDILIRMPKYKHSQIEYFYNIWLRRKEQTRIEDILKYVRSSFRLQHLAFTRVEIEKIAFEMINSSINESPETKAERYIDLARAVFSISLDDASAYFDYAIEVVSKFGDELVQRWDAIVEMADKGSNGNYISPELAYRFIRVAELVGEYAGGEKYWNRDEAIRICTKMSPASALATISRWRDRDVGWFKDQLYPLVEELLNQSDISSSVIWSFSAFFQGYRLVDFLAHCLQKESSPITRRLMLEQAIHDLRLHDREEVIWIAIKKLAVQYQLKADEIEKIISSYKIQEEKEHETDYLLSKFKDESNKIDWSKIFNDLDITTADGLSQAIERYNFINKKNDIYINSTILWSEAIRRVNDSNSLKFIKALISISNISYYTLQEAIHLLPNSWIHKPSVKRQWEQIIKSIGEKHAEEFTNVYNYNSFLKEACINESTVPKFQDGIIKGLAYSIELIDASTFFGSIHVIVSYLSPQECIELVNYALQRVEMHIKDDYADGKWDNWLIPPEDVGKAITGFIWSALGSPHNKIRWQAAHYVRRLSDNNCEREIDLLLNWMKHDEVDSFGSHLFPFYKLHARLYLLISLHRISLDKPGLLKKHKKIFIDYTHCSFPHILLQKLASEIALSIEKAYPNTYSSVLVDELRRLCISHFPKRDKTNNREGTIPWDIKTNEDGKYHHGWDIDHYWYESLGRVFNISERQISEYASDIIVNHWKIALNRNYVIDPRSHIWRSNYRDTYHSHGSYPEFDNYGFYLSYHSMFIVASQLLKYLPVVLDSYWEEDEWEEWLNRHLITRSDGKWLSDRRDPLPLNRFNEFTELQEKKWDSLIHNKDFLDKLIEIKDGSVWINVYGFWKDGDDRREENIHINSALVNPHSSEALVNALNSCSDPHDYKLPEYEDEEMEYNIEPFVLKGWVTRSEIRSGLDEFDPYSGNISYPPYEVGKSISQLLQIVPDDEKRIWHKINDNKPILNCEIWSSDLEMPGKERSRTGHMLKASLDLIKELCNKTNLELIVEIQIKRDYKNKYHNKGNNEEIKKYKFWKTLIITSKGYILYEGKRITIRGTTDKGI